MSGWRRLVVTYAAAMAGPSTSVAAIVAAVALVGCVFDGSVSEGGCTIALVAIGSGDHFAMPYHLELEGDVAGGEAQVILDGDGWAGQVSYRKTLPDGQTDEIQLDGRVLNEAQSGESFYELGVYRLAFRDRQGCRQEFNVEVVPPAPPAS